MAAISPDTESIKIGDLINTARTAYTDNLQRLTGDLLSAGRSALSIASENISELQISVEAARFVRKLQPLYYLFSYVLNRNPLIMGNEVEVLSRRSGAQALIDSGLDRPRSIEPNITEYRGNLTSVPFGFGNRTARTMYGDLDLANYKKGLEEASQDITRSWSASINGSIITEGLLRRISLARGIAFHHMLGWLSPMMDTLRLDKDRRTTHHVVHIETAASANKITRPIASAIESGIALGSTSSTLYISDKKSPLLSTESIEGIESVLIGSDIMAFNELNRTTDPASPELTTARQVATILASQSAEILEGKHANPVIEKFRQVVFGQEPIDTATGKTVKAFREITRLHFSPARLTSTATGETKNKTQASIDTAMLLEIMSSLAAEAFVTDSTILLIQTNKVSKDLFNRIFGENIVEIAATKQVSYDKRWKRPRYRGDECHTLLVDISAVLKSMKADGRLEFANYVINKVDLVDPSVAKELKTRLELVEV